MTKLTVAEYAEKYGITKQAVYKRINNLNTVEEIRYNRKVMLIVDEEEEDRKPEDKELNPNSTELNPDNQPNSTEEQPTDQRNTTAEINPEQPQLNPDNQPNSTERQENELNLSIIEILKTQLQEKDRQIERLQKAGEEKDRQIKEQFDRFSALLARSQELEARTQKLLEERGEVQEEESKAEIIPAEQIEEEPTPPKKRSLWSRLFNRE